MRDATNLTKAKARSKLSSNLLEAANRAEATALLIRAGYVVYRPEADVHGEDLVVRNPDGVLLPVQLKSRPYVDPSRYGDAGRAARGLEPLYMLFPDPTGKIPGRDWFLLRHQCLETLMRPHRKTNPDSMAAWSMPHIPKLLKARLKQYRHDRWGDSGIVPDPPERTDQDILDIPPQQSKAQKGRKRSKLKT